MTSPDRDRQNLTRWPPIVFLALTCVVLFEQVRFLFVYPVPDTGMWFGDESWTMLTARALAKTGVAHIPEAIGSSLAHSNGLVNGSIWITGFLYGLPALLFGATATLVSIGRIGTLLLSLWTLMIVYGASRRLTHDNALAASIAVLALVVCDAFAFSSHSARFDAATGLAVLAYLLFLSRQFERRDAISTKAVFSVTFLACISLAIYVHVPTLIALPALYALWRFKIFSDVRLILSALLGAIVACILLTGLYWATTGSLDLLGKGYNQYYNVANSLPIVHPLSWRVQKINTIDRAIQVWDVAWPLVALLVAGAIATIRGRTRFSEARRFWLMLTGLTLVDWCAFEGPAVFYNIHILPVLAVTCAVLLTTMQANPRTWIYGFLLSAMVVTTVTIINQERRGQTAARLVTENSLSSFVAPAYGERLLADEPALAEMTYLECTSKLSLATKHFLLFGSENKSPSHILKEHDVRYLLLYSTIRYQSQLRPVADSFYRVIAQRTGHLTDQARSYDDPQWEQVDTVRLYKMK